MQNAWKAKLLEDLISHACDIAERKVYTQILKNDNLLHKQSTQGASKYNNIPSRTIQQHFLVHVIKINISQYLC